MHRLAISLVRKEEEKEAPYPIFAYGISANYFPKNTYSLFFWPRNKLLLFLLFLLEGIQLCRDYVNFYGTYETN